jgi:hypothetical protein
MNINLLEINADASYIVASVTVEAGNRVANVYAWNQETYKTAADVIDLSSLLEGTSEDEDFTIPASALGTESISGVWIIEFYANNSTIDPLVGDSKTNIPTVDDEAPVEGLVANLIGYHECVLEKGLNIVVKDCKIQRDNCGNTDSLIFAATLLDLLHQALTFSQTEEAIRIASALDDVCDICAGCPDYAPGLSNIGYGFKTVDNVITPT